MKYLRKTHEITGYIIWRYDGVYTILCRNCYTSNSNFCWNGIVRPITLGSEWDNSPVCESCGEEIEVTILDYGADKQ